MRGDKEVIIDRYAVPRRHVQQVCKYEIQHIMTCKGEHAKMCLNTQM